MNDSNSNSGVDLTTRVIGVGQAGASWLRELAPVLPEGVEAVFLDSDARALGRSAGMPVCEVAPALRGLGAGGDPLTARRALEADLDPLREVVQGVKLVVVLAGLGGGIGSAAAPILARLARESGVLSFAMVTLPFEFEGDLRAVHAEDALASLREAADGVLSLPNRAVLRLVGDRIRVTEALEESGRQMAVGFLGLWRLLHGAGVNTMDLGQLTAFLGGPHPEYAFASSEGQGIDRIQEALDRLLASPFLEGGLALAESARVHVSVVSGPDLTVSEIQRVREDLIRQSGMAQFSVGTFVDPAMGDRVGLTLLAARRGGAEGASRVDRGVNTLDHVDTQFLRRNEAPRPPSRFVAPPPSLPEQRKHELLSGQARAGRGRKSRLKQELLPLEIVSRGRFEKSAPTIHHGEDLDVPTYIRRGFVLN